MQRPDSTKKLHRQVNERTVEELAKVADLPLAAERRKLIALELDLLIQAANELSRKMSAAINMGVAPSTRLVHTPARTESA